MSVAWSVHCMHGQCLPCYLVVAWADGDNAAAYVGGMFSRRITRDGSGWAHGAVRVLGLETYGNCLSYTSAA